MNKSILRILIITVVCLGLFACSSSSESIDVKKEVENIYKLEDQGNKVESKKIYNSLMQEVDKLHKSGKKEEARELFERIMYEMDVQKKLRREMRRLEKEKEKSDVSSEKGKSEEFDWWSSMNPFPERAKKKEKQENVEKNNE